MAKSLTLRGRSIVALGLVGFLLVATSVITRRMVGFRQGREQRQLETTLRDLENNKKDLEASIRSASSRARLQSIAEQRLHMHIATGSEIVYIPRRTPE